MQPLTYQQTSGFSPTAVINRSQTKQVPGHEKIRDAVRAWSAADNQDVVAALIVNEYREQGGGTIDFPDDVSRARQKLFRFLDNKFDSEKYRNNVRELTPAILAVLPLEYRGYLVEQDSFMTRLAEMEKELSEAKQAVILNAPRHQKLKEISEGIVSMFRVDPDLAGPLMAMVTTMLGAIGQAQKWRKPVCGNRADFQVQIVTHSLRKELWQTLLRYSIFQCRMWHKRSGAWQISMMVIRALQMSCWKL